MNPDIELDLIHRGNLVCNIPFEYRNRQFGTVLPAKVWRNISLNSHFMLNNYSMLHFPWNGNVPRIITKVPIISTIHDVLPLIIPNYFRNDEEHNNYIKSIQSTIDRSDLIITDSEFSKKEILGRFLVKKEPVVIPLGSPLSEFNTLNIQKCDKQSYFIYVGGYHKRKGLVELIKAYYNMSINNIIKSKLIIVGEKNYISEEFDKLVNECVKLGTVEEKGYVNDDELVMLLKNAEALIYPSKYEGFGLPVLEAMQLGCPVITTRHTSLPEVCGEAAIYVNPENIDELENAILSILNNSEMRNNLILSGRQQAEKFSWNKAACKFLQSIEDICIY